MTAHVVYTALDAERPASTSPRIIAEIIRGSIGFQGVLVCDDLGMAALSGSMGERAALVRAAGCDLALHCGGDMGEMEDVAASIGPITNVTEERLQAGEARRTQANAAGWDRAAAVARLDELLAGTE
jgi:beta-N-acetylhexosaminidase